MVLMWLMWIMAIVWTALIITFSISSFKTHQNFRWLEIPEKKLAYVSYIMTNITFGIAIWWNTIGTLKVCEFMPLLIIGTLYFILSIIASKRGRLRMMERWERWKR